MTRRNWLQAQIREADSDVQRWPEWMKKDADSNVKDIAALIQQIAPLLAGKAPAVQGSVLADLTAMWLAGYDVGDVDTTRRLRIELLAGHCEAILDLVGPNARLLGTTP